MGWFCPCVSRWDRVHFYYAKARVGMIPLLAFFCFQSRGRQGDTKDSKSMAARFDSSASCQVTS